MHIGVDLGSRTIKIASLVDGTLHSNIKQESGFRPHQQAAKMLEQFSAEKIIATGYGRHLAHKHFANEVITEIKAHALGARYFFPDCRTILDVGGQDCKVISLNASGRVSNFQMNDKCAAGTGRFLEIMALSLGYDIDEFGQAALESENEAAINSMCTVFAESEVISMKNSGLPTFDIAKGVHLSVVNRLASMLNRNGHGETIVFSGGVANNTCVVKTLAATLGVQILVPPSPDIVGAIGAAIHAEKG